MIDVTKVLQDIASIVAVASGVWMIRKTEREIKKLDREEMEAMKKTNQPRTPRQRKRGK